MKQLKPISLSQLNTDELFKTGKALLELGKPLEELSDFAERNLYNIRKALLTQAEIDNEELTKEETEEIRDLDGKLDALLPIIESDLQGNVKKAEFYPQKGESSSAILTLFEKRDRKKLFYGGYSAQGREMEALRAELFTPEFDLHRENSGISELFTALDTTYVELQKHLNNRLSEGNLKVTLKEIKGEMRYRIEALLSYIDVNINDGIGVYENLTTPINQLITEVMQAYKTRMTLKANAQEN